MSESVRQDLPTVNTDDRVVLQPSAEQLLAISAAAELIGWTVTDFVLSAALDRAERDLYQHAAQSTGPSAGTDPTGPVTALLVALS